MTSGSEKGYGRIGARCNGQLLKAWLAVVVVAFGCFASPAAADMWFDDFNDGDVEDGTPLEWASHPAFTGIYDASSGDYYLAGMDLQNGITGVANDNETLATIAIAGDEFVTFAETASVRVRARIDGPGGAGATLFGDGEAPNGYTALVENTGGLFITAFDLDLGGEYQLEQGSLELDPDEELTEVYLQFDAIPQPDLNGTEMAITAWTLGEPQPAEPQLTTLVDDPVVIEQLPFEGQSGILFNEETAEGFEGEGTGTFHWALAGSSKLITGDVNGDGQVNGLDVDPFVDVLLNGPYHPLADMNSDDQVNGLDVDPFVAAVVGGGQAAVPEPSTLALAFIALVGGACSVARRRRGS